MAAYSTTKPAETSRRRMSQSDIDVIRRALVWTAAIVTASSIAVLVVLALAVRASFGG